MIVFIYTELKIVGLGEADRLAVLQGCPGIPGAAGRKGEPGLSGTKGKIPKISDCFFLCRKMCEGDTPTHGSPWSFSQPTHRESESHQ